MTDTKILTLIKNGERDKAIRQLYKHFPMVRKIIRNAGGNKEQATEVFHDSLILFCEKVRQPEFELTSKLSTYLVGISRFVWMNYQRKLKTNKSVEWKESLIVIADDFDYSAEKESQFQRLETILDSISEKCKAMLELFYIRKKSMSEISEELGFSSVNSAKTQKYKCLEKAIQLVPKNQTHTA